MQVFFAEAFDFFKLTGWEAQFWKSARYFYSFPNRQALDPYHFAGAVALIRAA